MIPRREVEVPGRAHAAQLPGVVLAALGHLGVHEVREREGGRLEGAARGLGLGFEARRLLLQQASLGAVGLALLGRELALARLLVVVAAAAGLVELGLERGEPLLERDRALEVDRDAPAAAALEDLGAALLQGAGVEHGAGV